jgi:cell division protein FtsZ
MKEAFEKADNVLATAAKCITDVINSTGQINVDFADVCTVMSNGGVAILGSAIAEGDNRAQVAIENALNSPLLNDSEIRGARWILININSAEGDHEFTMDEVEIIQNYLISKAGEESDVILGLGYDNTLGAGISITLIATGFEHKDPFAKANNLSKEEKKNEKIVMTLEMPVKEEKKILHQPSLQFGESQSPEVAEPTVELVPEIEKAIDESMMPSLVVEAIEEISVEPFIVATDENTANPVVFFEISTGADQAPVIEFDIPTSVAPVEKKMAKVDTPPTEFISEQKEANTITPSAARYLEKPANIYVSETPRSVAPIPAEDISPSVDDAIEDEHSLVAMHMVIKDEFSMDEEKQHEQSSQSILMARVEEQPVLDETEELRRRATDRIAKLRNLSFNINAADPNNEFETVPAYLRRNMELHNSIADVESFYSNYTVKGDESNVIEPGINSFLDGKKPD